MKVINIFKVNFYKHNKIPKYLQPVYKNKKPMKLVEIFHKFQIFP